MDSCEVFNLAVKSIQHIGLIEDVEILETNIRFTWSQSRFRVSTSLMVEEVSGGFLISNDKAKSLECLLKG